MSDEDLWRLSASQIVAATAAGEISAEDSISAAVDRMHAVNPGLNAVVVDLSDQALERAKSLDAAKAKGAAVGPLSWPR